MEETTSKEKMLTSIRNAIISKSTNPFPGLDLETSIYKQLPETPDLIFAQEFSNVNGQFVYCEDILALLENLQLMSDERGWKNIFSFDNQINNLLNKANIEYSSKQEDFKDLKVAITFCEFLVAGFGSILISSRQTAGRRLNICSEIHVVIAMTSQIVPDIKSAFGALQEKYSGRLPSLISLITGPSITLGIESKPFIGGQGPREVFLFLVDDTPISLKDE